MLAIRPFQSHWRQIQRGNFTSMALLADFLDWGEEERSKVLLNPSFVMNVPRRLAEKMEKRNINDPLVRQFVPLKEEMVALSGFVSDAVGDLPSRCAPSLLKKYEGRALLLSTSGCAMHCRYCFRREYPYEDHEKSYKKELDYLKNDPTIDELILSGGDPLSLSNEALKALFSELESIPHLQRLRFHSRFPIGIPERIDEELIDLLANLRLKCWFIMHVNHPKELDEDIFDALKKLQLLGIPILNQAVLLKGVNDSEEVLKGLFQTLANQGIFAYYLHSLDKVTGTAHFEVPEERGLELIRYLEEHLPGYAVPKYVREVPGDKSKRSLYNVTC